MHAQTVSRQPPKNVQPLWSSLGRRLGITTTKMVEQLLLLLAFFCRKLQEKASQSFNICRIVVEYAFSNRNCQKLQMNSLYVKFPNTKFGAKLCDEVSWIFQRKLLFKLLNTKAASPWLLSVILGRLKSKVSLKFISKSGHICTP